MSSFCAKNTAKVNMMPQQSGLVESSVYLPKLQLFTSLCYYPCAAAQQGNTNGETQTGNLNYKDVELLKDIQ